MPKPYVITYRIDDSQAQAAFQRSMANAKAAEAAWNRAGGAQQNQAKQARARVQDEVNGQRKIEIGLNKLQVTGLKYHDKLREASKKRMQEEERAYDKQFKQVYDIDKIRSQAIDFQGKQREKLIKAHNKEYDAQLKQVYDINKLRSQAADFRHKQQAHAQRTQEKVSLDQEKRLSRETRLREQMAAREQKRLEKQAALDTKEFDRKVAAVNKHAAAEAAAVEKTEKAKQGIIDRFFMRDQSRANRFAAQKQKQVRQELTDDEIAFRVKNAQVDKINKTRLDGAMKAAGLEKESHTNWLARVVKIHLAYMAMRAVSTVFTDIANAMREVNEESVKAGEAMLDKMQQVRSLASVMGVTPTREFAEEQARFDIATGMPGQKGQQFRETFRGKAQKLRGDTISEKEFDIFEMQAAKLISAKGLEPGLGGDVAGAILKAEDFKKAGKGSKEAMARLANALAIMDAFSGTLKQLAPEFTAIVATLVDETGGTLRNVEEAAVALAVEAEFKPGEGEVFTRRGFAALRDFTDKKKREFFKRSGITAQTQGLEHFDLAVKAIGEKMAEDKVPVDVALQRMGITEQREVIALRTLFNAREKVLAKAKPMMGAITPAGAEALTEKLTMGREGEAFRAEQAKARVAGAEVIGGADRAAWQIAKKNAEAEIKEEALEDPFRMFFREVGGAMRGGMFLKGGGREKLIEERAMGRLRQEAGMPQSPLILGMMAPWAVPLVKRMQENPAHEAEALGALIENNRQIRELNKNLKARGGAPGKPVAGVPADVLPWAGAIRAGGV